MHEDSIAIVVIGVVELLLLASLSTVVLRRARFPYTIGPASSESSWRLPRIGFMC